MSDTPLTDAEEKKLTKQLGTIGAVPADFARHLELQAKHGWARAAENDRNYGAALAERDRLRDELAKTAKSDISHGNRYPFDASNDWWHSSGDKPPKPVDWAHAAARGIIKNLQGRQGIKHELHEQKIDEETRKEIVESLAEIIRTAKP